MAEIELVIFDCDGVLMDSEIVAAAVEMEVYKEFGIEMEVAEFAQRFAGKDSALILQDMETELGHGLPEGTLEKIKAEVDARCGLEAKMIEGADVMLDLLDQARCICSNGAQIRMRHMLDRVGLYDRFRPYIFSAKDFDPPRHKPQPDLFLKALEEFNVRPEQALVVEDSVHGIGGAKAAGTRVVGFTGASHTYSTHADELIDAGAETVIKRLTDLPSVVEAFGQWEMVG
ncbi:MAG: HAD family phosphatase [Pseudomonadota bacterium]